VRYYKYLCSNCSKTWASAVIQSTACPHCGVGDPIDITTRGEAAGIGLDSKPVTTEAADRRAVILQVLDTLEWGNKKHGNEFASAHEAIAVLREEYLELEHEVFHGDRNRIREEALQVAAVAIKLIMHVDGISGGES
jgi:hypothetical protein